MFLFIKVNKSLKAYQFWVWSHFTLALVYVFLGLRGTIPIYYSILLNNLFLVLTFNFRITACLHFFNHKISLKHILSYSALFLSIILYFTLIEDSIFIRTLSVTILIFFTYSYLSWILYKNKNKENAGIILFGIVVFLFYVGLNFARIILIFTDMQSVIFNNSSPFNSVYFTSLLILEVIWVTLFFALTGIRNRMEIREMKEHFEMIFRTSPEAILISRMSDGKILNLNEGFVRITGYTMEEALGKSPLELGIWQSVENRERMRSELFEKGYCENLEFEFQKKDKTKFTGIVSSRVIEVNGEEQVISVTRDISQRKEAERIIQEKNKELHELNITKDKFFSIIAHDLKSPFTGFLGLTELMSDDSGQMKPEEFLSLGKSLHESANNIYSLLENLLEWSRNQRGIIEFEPEIYSLKNIIDENIANIGNYASQKGIEIYNLTSIDITVYADISMLNSILRNLLSNSVKFSNRGNVVKIDAERTEKNETLISVEDNGIGMKPELVQQLFRIDQKVARYGTEGETSTGLGLLLCKEFTDRHNGKIGAESKEQEGSRFWVLLPGPPT
ncbi:PAS domain-containing sensor histidine kinase [Leptospira idonii]|uniref:PAS domain-containing sensor histidine kinase n=1 Tax=Leptospira idonii TaxID=1193500 RepID=UPI00143852A4|nr:PAS domain-containing sensor histidine kinase [Leptospira idonii]